MSSGVGKGNLALQVQLCIVKSNTKFGNYVTKGKHVNKEAKKKHRANHAHSVVLQWIMCWTISWPAAITSWILDHCVTVALFTPGSNMSLK